ncbi:heavy metal translocating P-type ATPase [Sulfurospirillum barnesii]|uniref:P-type Zn(2+) transporter n=1 Tax=Sulfurospirillum barnesii (strain ATCC 700032 / DSM 10660 / SES-3) TaxID=760154 RepID=I3XY68_SULBS|nr:cation-translocating P-type ATPase [Sulfurospirillum barnesii]AFL68892.1 heavy metal translocating P-type ATPase [Sulfurospirillum barnesii SES-3]
MNEISIKSFVSGRVRLKCEAFKTVSTHSLETLLSPLVFEQRLNRACASLILRFDPLKSSLESILEALQTSLHVRIKTPELSASAALYCDACSSCHVKSLDAKTPVSWRSKMVGFALLSVYALGLFVVETFFATSVALSFLPAVTAIVAFVAALPLFQEAIEDVKARRFSLHSFMAVALLGAILGGEVTAAFEIIYILRGGMLLEEYTAERSKKQIHELMALGVKKAYVVVDEVELEVDVSEIKEGDIVVARSGEKIAVDGIISEGSAEIDEAAINGRSEPALRVLGDSVYANTLVQRGRIYIRVSATGEKTYLARMIASVESSLAQKSPSEVSADKLAAKLLKLGTLLTAGTFLLTGSWLRAFSVMIVMSCPCATILAASTAISAGIARGAKEGILIKGGAYLEAVSQSDVFCFDKTGTLTTGVPHVIGSVCAPDVSYESLLYYAALAEHHNSHPIGIAITKAAHLIGFTCKEENPSEIYAGLGVLLHDKAGEILVGNAKWMEQNAIDIASFKRKSKKSLQEGKSVVYVALNQKALGFLSLEHEVREGTLAMLQGLRKRGVKHLVLLSGDEEVVARSFAQTYGFDEIHANVMPEEKASVIEALKERYKSVVMVGDGINDTLAMSKADVAISFASGGSEAAIEVSNIAITNSHPHDILKLYDLSAKSLGVVNQNYWIGTGTNLVGVGLAGVGLLSPVAAGAIHIGHTVGIMANSSRIAWSVDNNS